MEQELNGSKSHIGIRKMIYYKKHSKIGLTHFCFLGSDFFLSVSFIKAKHELTVITQGICIVWGTR